MPGFPKIDEKKISELFDTSPIVITQVDPATVSKTSSTKKYIIVAASIIIASVIILAAILIGIHMFTEAEKELIKYTLDFDKNTKQHVTSDPNLNVVQYKIQNSGQKTWVVNDFNKDIQVVKIKTATQTNCYLSALNRTKARDPTQITGPETKEIKEASTLTYVTSGTPISDISFLAAAAREACQGISTYWLYPRCGDSTPQSTSPPSRYSTVFPNPTTMLRKPTDKPANNNNNNGSIDNSPWYVYWSYPYRANVTVSCVTGCCKTVCACNVDYFWYYSAGSLYCTWVTASCPGYGVYDNPVAQSCSDGPRGLACPNYSPAALPDC